MSAVLSAAGLAREFPQDGSVLRVLSDLSLTVEEGEFLCIVGASGAGKSTLLHILGGLDRDYAGTVRVAGQDLAALSRTALARFRNQTLGFVFQLHHLLPEFSAAENVAMPALIGGAVRDSEARTRAADLLQRVGLAERSDHAPSELSGGERQRVALARALMLSPKVVLADEPTGNLDPVTAGSIHETMLQANREHGQTFVVATHSRELAARATRVLRLEDGALHAGRNAP